MKAEEIFYRLIKEKVPLADIKIIFNEFFKCDFDKIYTSSFNIDDELVNKVLEAIKINYPIAYLVKHVKVQDIDMYVDENVLIPRVETENFLIEEIVNKKDLNGKTVLDLCTGSGFIAILLKKKFPNALISASDISISALNIAEMNAKTNNTKIEFIQSDYLKNIDKKYSLIISNPPYIEEDNLDVFAPFEPKLALYAGKDGLSSYKEIFTDLKKHILRGGEAYFELESTNAENVYILAEKMLNPISLSFIKDWENKNRYLKIQF